MVVSPLIGADNNSIRESVRANERIIKELYICGMVLCITNKINEKI